MPARIRFDLRSAGRCRTIYNDLHQIVQTPDSILILTEMVHDARIVRMKRSTFPRTSAAGWAIRWAMGGGHARCRYHEFQRQDPVSWIDRKACTWSNPVRGWTTKRSLYRFTMEDADTWDRPWTGEYTWPATGKLIYEYACHEGNYALSNVLRGARRQEAEQAAAKAKDKRSAMCLRR